MASYPVEIRRCRHIRTNGTQCGSPALKKKRFCYYHEQNQPRAVMLYIDGERYPDAEFMLCRAVRSADGRTGGRLRGRLPAV
jgi:hypothetical protein